jgi:acid stress chaperone HdeA
MPKPASFVRVAAVPLTVALVALGIAAASHAAKKTGKLNAKELTCEEFLALGTEVQPRVVYWLEGYSKSGQLDDAEIDVDALERPVAMVVTECHKAPKASLLEKIERYF